MTVSCAEAGGRLVYECMPCMLAGLHLPLALQHVTGRADIK